MVTAPAPAPVTIPVEPTVAIPVLLLTQLPPLVPSSSVIVDPTHTAFAVVVIDEGLGLTVMGCIA
jgi:hypothetical protein